MELVLVIGGFVALAVASVLGGVDSRPTWSDDEPHRAI